MASTPTTTAVETGVSGGSLEISLHPLVLVNISDHYTRTDPTSTPRVIGALLGSQSGRTVEIFNSFELVYEDIEGQVVLDLSYLKTKLEQFQKVFKNYDVLGWYSTGHSVLPGDMLVQKSLLAFNESPLYMIVDPVSLPKARDLPVHLFESELHIVEGEAIEMFAKVPYKIETMEAERIAVDHVARVVPEARIVAHLDGMRNAIAMLTERIAIIQKFLEATARGDIPKDHGILRKIASLCHRLPALNTDAFSHDFLREYNDGLLLAYLGVLTTGVNAAHDLVDAFSMVTSREYRQMDPWHQWG